MRRFFKLTQSANANLYAIELCVDDDSDDDEENSSIDNGGDALMQNKCGSNHIRGALSVCAFKLVSVFSCV